MHCWFICFLYNEVCEQGSVSIQVTLTCLGNHEATPERDHEMLNSASTLALSTQPVLSIFVISCNSFQLLDNASETSQFANSLPLGTSQFLAECLESTSLLVQQWSACTGHVAGYISHARNISSATYERRARFCRSGILSLQAAFSARKSWTVLLCVSQH